MSISRFAHVSLACVLVCPAALALSEVTNQRVSKQAPPPSGCVVPSSDATFSPSDATVYLYFEATESNSDYVTNDWVSADGTVISGGGWSTSSGRYCFIGASLGISNTPTNRLGSWQARVFNNGVIVFSIPFTIANSGGGPPTITDANPRTIPTGVNSTITLTGYGFQAGFSGKLWVGNTPWPINAGAQAIFDSSSQVRLTVQVGQPTDPTSAFGLQVVNPDGTPSNIFTGLTATQSSTGGSGATQRMTSGWYWPSGSSNFCGYLGWLGLNSAEANPYHLGQDMCNTRGNPIYAIGSGSVIYSRTDVDGYGPNYTKGGALVARHQATDGTWFTALYGHLDSPHAVGSISAGEILGYTNDFSPSHLHFGLHPGFDPEQTDPWRGYTNSTSNTYGFTDPIPFLNAHPLNTSGTGGGSGSYQPGDGATDPSPWVQAFYRNQFNTYSIAPTDNPVSSLGPGCIQYFRATDTQQKTEVLVQRSCTGTVNQIYGGIWNKYVSDAHLGGPTGSIGYPTTDRQTGRSAVDGQTFDWQEFQTTGGASTRIVQYNGTAYAVFAGILSYWASQGYETSRLGIPTSDEFDWGSNGCKRQNFQNGWYVWWSPVPGGTCNGY